MRKSRNNSITGHRKSSMKNAVDLLYAPNSYSISNRSPQPSNEALSTFYTSHIGITSANQRGSPLPNPRRTGNPIEEGEISNPPNLHLKSAVSFYSPHNTTLNPSSENDSYSQDQKPKYAKQLSSIVTSMYSRQQSSAKQVQNKTGSEIGERSPLENQEEQVDGSEEIENENKSSSWLSPSQSNSGSTSTRHYAQLSNSKSSGFSPNCSPQISAILAGEHLLRSKRVSVHQKEADWLQQQLEQPTKLVAVQEILSKIEEESKEKECLRNQSERKSVCFARSVLDQPSTHDSTRNFDEEDEVISECSSSSNSSSNSDCSSCSSDESNVSISPKQSLKQRKVGAPSRESTNGFSSTIESKGSASKKGKKQKKDDENKKPLRPKQINIEQFRLKTSQNEIAGGQNAAVSHKLKSKMNIEEYSRFRSFHANRMKPSLIDTDFMAMSKGNIMPNSNAEGAAAGTTSASPSMAMIPLRRSQLYIESMNRLGQEEWRTTKLEIGEETWNDKMLALKSNIKQKMPAFSTKLLQKYEQSSLASQVPFFTPKRDAGRYVYHPPKPMKESFCVYSPLSHNTKDAHAQEMNEPFEQISRMNKSQGRVGSADFHVSNVHSSTILNQNNSSMGGTFVVHRDNLPEKNRYTQFSQSLGDDKKSIIVLHQGYKSRNHTEMKEHRIANAKIELDTMKSNMISMNQKRAVMAKQIAKKHALTDSTPIIPKPLIGMAKNQGRSHLFHMQNLKKEKSTLKFFDKSMSSAVPELVDEAEQIRKMKYRQNIYAVFRNHVRYQLMIGNI